MIRSLRFPAILGLLLLVEGLSSHAPAQAVLVNVSANDCAPLAQAIQDQGLTVKSIGATDSIDPGTRLIVWEAKAGQDATPDQVQQIGEAVRHGASLLLSFDPNPGITPMHMAFMLPTIPWATGGNRVSRSDLRGRVSALHWDKTLFPQDEPDGLRLAFHYDIQPATAVELGLQRYDVLDYSDPDFDLKHQAGDFFWTRPLLNRDWTVQIRGSDGAETPLLITGRYGAGRVAVFASSVTSVPAAQQKMWEKLAAWLNVAAPATSDASASASSVALTVSPLPSKNSAGENCVAVDLQNSSASPVSGTILARFLTWEETMAGDAQQAFNLPAQGKATVLLPFPAAAAGPIGYQSLEFRNAYDVRVGVLSADETTLLAETHEPVDLDPPIGLSVATDNVQSIPYPFPDAPGPEVTMLNRMGTPIMAYAYKPGQTVNATVTVANGARDLNPLAKVEDETQAGNASVIALSGNGSQMEKTPRGGIEGYGAWTGQAGVENILKFTFPQPVWVSGIVLNGNSIDHRGYLTHNPESVSVECDGKQVASVDGLDAKFVSGLGLVRVDFSPVQARVIRVHLPWKGTPAAGRPRSAPELGGLLVEGSLTDFPPALSGTVTLTFSDALAGTENQVGQQNVSVAPGATQTVPFSFPLPAGAATAFYRLSAGFSGQQKSVPILVIAPRKTLLSSANLHPANAPGMSFTVSAGFRNGSPVGTGTRESFKGAWASPDDLAWTWSHGMKQVGAGRPAAANSLFAVNDTIGHYGNPWTSFRNGELYFPTVVPEFLERMKKSPNWANSDRVLFGFSDRWDSGPSMNSMFTWQDLVGFDDYLRSQGKPGLKGQTSREMAADIRSEYPGLWQDWQMSRYVTAVESVRKAFAAEGKTVVMSGQGIPLMPSEQGKIIAQTVRGMSDDNTWGMANEDIPLTTGRQIAAMAYDPWWGLGSNFPWGWNSSILDNPFWFAAPGTTEPSRRHEYERAWRATIDDTGGYRSMFTYGFGMNGGFSYVMNQDDWQQNWYAQERSSLIYPDGPIGAGLVISTAAMDDPSTVLFSGGGMGDSPAQHAVDVISPIFGKLQHAGLSIPFAASISSVSKWKGRAPLIVADLSAVSDAEVAKLRDLVNAGDPIAAFQGSGHLSNAAANLFSVNADGSSAGGEAVGQPTSGLKLPVIAHGSTLFIPADGNNLQVDDLRALAPLLASHLHLPIQFPEGTAGYGFTASGISYIVVEDWLEQGRNLTIRVHAGPGKTARAVNVNDHQPLTVHRDQNDWVIDLPMRPADGVLIALSELP